MTTALTQPWAERLAWTLLHFIWQGTLLAAIYSLARLATGSLTARARYAMACAALLASLLAACASQPPPRPRRGSDLPGRGSAACRVKSTSGVLRTSRVVSRLQQAHESQLNTSALMFHTCQNGPRRRARR